MKSLLLKISISACAIFNVSILSGQNTSTGDAKVLTMTSIDSEREAYRAAAMQIWDWAELGYQETQSSLLLQGLLQDHGFKVESGVAGMPTAFVASYGSGEPVIGILAEFDALPGVSQEAVPYRKKREDGVTAGHACGHHLFGTGGVAAAIEVGHGLHGPVAGGLPG